MNRWEKTIVLVLGAPLAVAAAVFFVGPQAFFRYFFFVSHEGSAPYLFAIGAAASVVLAYAALGIWWVLRRPNTSRHAPRD